MRPRNFLYGVPELLILQLLSKREMYGYEIVESVKEIGGADFSFGEGVIYPRLYNMEGRGYVSSKEREGPLGRRIYYSLTKKGRAHCSSLTNDWHQITGRINTWIDKEGLGEATA